VHPLADELDSHRSDVRRLVSRKQRDRARQHGGRVRPPGSLLAALAGQRVGGREPDPFGWIVERLDQGRGTVGVHQSVKDQAAVLADLRAGMPKPATCRRARRRAEPLEPLVSLKAAVRVGQRVDEVRGGQVGGQLGYDHASSMQAAALASQHNYAVPSAAAPAGLAPLGSPAGLPCWAPPGRGQSAPPGWRPHFPVCSRSLARFRTLSDS
jgi:hypothetical protein